MSPRRPLLNATTAVPCVDVESTAPNTSRPFRAERVLGQPIGPSALPSVRGYRDFDELVEDLPEARQ